MRGLVGIVAILAALLVVAVLARQQLHGRASAPAAAAPSDPAQAVDAFKAEQQVRDGLAAAAAEARRRNDAADQAN